MAGEKERKIDQSTRLKIDQEMPEIVCQAKFVDRVKFTW